MTINQKIRKVVANRATVEISRECSYKPGYKFVKLFDNGAAKGRETRIAALKKDLLAAGIPAEQGRLANEISFHVTFVRPGDLRD
jgi:hypothetical protein